MGKRVFLATRDLLFRAKLAAVVEANAGAITHDDAVCDLAVVETEIPGAADRIRGFIGRGIPVLAYGSHVGAELLRAARAAGATAVPNSQVERRLGELLTST